MPIGRDIVPVFNKNSDNSAEPADKTTVFFGKSSFSALKAMVIISVARNVCRSNDILTRSFSFKICDRF